MGLFNEKLSAGAIRHLTFGIPELDKVDWKRNGTVEVRGLLLHPGLARPSLEFDMVTATTDELRRAAYESNRPLKEGILEWVRFVPYRIEMFLA